MELVSSFVIVVLFGSTDCCAVGVLGSLFFGVNICLSDDREGMRWVVSGKSMDRIKKFGNAVRVVDMLKHNFV